MNIDLNYIAEYKKKGFVLINNFFNKNDINNLKNLIYNNGFNEKKSEIYYEEINGKKRIRRVENLSYHYSEFDNFIYNELLLKYLKEIFNEDPVLFKEKLNFKPSGGGGNFRMHIDGHFDWIDSSNNKRKGWQEYGSNFVNVVIPIEKSTKLNGCLYVCEKSETERLFGNNWDIIKSNLDGFGPYLKAQDEEKVNKVFIEQNAGDLLLFDWKCIHGSEKNESDFERPILYLTYNSKSNGDNLKKYYIDKKNSLNNEKAKSLY